MPRALISVTDKVGVVDFAQALQTQGYEILSTGGTAKTLREAGLTVTDVAEVTSFPEMLDGRVKTLHPLIHGGLLGDRTNPNHVQQMSDANIVGIDILCVNLYAFEKTVTQPHQLDQAIESIDIGGPAMVRAAAKNFKNVTVIVDPADYQSVLDHLAQNTIQEFRLKLSAKAFRHTAFYDSMVSRYLSSAAGEPELTENLTLGMRSTLQLRYGENPHQTGALYADPLAKPGVAQAEQLWGKELSYNNILDSDGAWELVNDLPENSCAIIKHGNPCGAASSTTFGQAYTIAKASDPISAFGGIAAFNGVVDEEAALAMTAKNNFLEVILGTDFTAEAIEIFKNRSGWGQNVRLLKTPIPPTSTSLTLRSVRGGVLIQDSDEDPNNEWTVPTKRQPTEDEWAALKLGWKIIPHVKSNAIVISNHTQLLGVGAGQMNRVQSVRLALQQAGEHAKGAALASDAFFPFPDSIQTAAAEGVTAFIQPGGSVKDADNIKVADELGITMVFTGTRHFRH